MAIGPHVCDSWKWPNKRKLKYNAKPIYKISSFFIWYLFSFIKDIIFHLLLIKCLKINFLNGFANKNSKLLNGFKSNCFISIPFTTKIQQNVWPITSIFKYICNFHILRQVLSRHIYFPYVQILQGFFFSKLIH